MPHRDKTLIISSFAHAYSHACILSIPPLVLLLKEEFSTSLTLISLIITISGVLFGVGAIPFGTLSDRIGSLKVQLIGILMAMASCIGLFISWDLLSFSAFLFLLGLASSTYHPSAFRLISTSFPKNVGRAFGINGMIGNIGQIGAPIASAFIAYQWGWRPVFLMLLGFGIVLCMLFTTIHERPIEGRSGSIRDIHISKEYLLAMLVTMTAGLAYRGTTTMLPTYSSLIYGKDTFEAGALVTLMLTTGGVSQLISGEIRDRYGTAKPLFAVSLMLFLSIMALPFVGYYAFMVGLMVFGFAYFAVNLYTNTLVGEITESNLRGTYYGITFFTRFGLGFMAPFIVGALSDIYSIDYLFYIILSFVSVFMGLVTVLTFLIPRCHAPRNADTIPDPE
ncbi:MAG TPA: MFS transporter [Candidatus Methanofastidiosa archaeon]|nr:MFS transporter [Candidatus Methanofastidiosa archaeon]